jgi:hypothetical protein
MGIFDLPKSAAFFLLLLFLDIQVSVQVSDI